ncbi:MAG: MFS transporter [Bdellovibrionia bacterium]
MPDKISKLVFRYYGFQFFFSLLLWLPIFYEYQKRLGLKDTEIFQIQSLYYISFCLIEIPTGVLADRWGRLPCLRLGALICLISNLLPVVVDFNWIFKGLSNPHSVYFQFLFHFLLLALARSLISGASSAYLYDHLQALRKSDEFKKVEGRARSYGLLGKVVVWPLTGILMSWHLSLPYWLTALAAALSVGFAWSLPNDYVVRDTERLSEVKFEGRLDVKNVKKGFTYWVCELKSVLEILTRTPILYLIMFQGIAIFVLARICQVNLFHPLLILKSFDVSSFGTVMALMTVFEALGSGNPRWLRKWMTDLNAVFLWTAVSALCLFALTLNGKWGTLVSLSVFSFAVGACFPIQRQLFNDYIPQARYRATLMSIESILDRAVCAWVASVLGAYISDGKIEIFLRYSAGLTGAGILILLITLISSRYVTSGTLQKRSS